MPRQPIAISFQEGRSPPLAASRLINFYMEPAPLNSRAPKFQAGAFSTVGGALYGTPGVPLYVTAGSGTIRAGRYALGYLYVLSGAELYRINLATGAATLCTGDRLSASGNAMMTDNGVQLCVLTNGFVYTVVGTVIARIVSGAFPAAGVGSIDTIDGYTIFTSADGATAVYDTATNITGLTQANPAVVTAVGHGLSDGDLAFIQSVGGMTSVNNRSFSVAIVDADHFQLVGIDSAGFGAYTSGGSVQRVIAHQRGQWFISAQYDSASIDVLDFANAESKPDTLSRVLVANREIWLFGPQSIEPWQNTGASPFPFERITGAVMNRGTAAPLSPAELFGTAFWLGDDLIVYSATGYAPSRISNFAVEEALRQMSDVSDAFGFTYSQAGHNFYVLTCPTGKRTLVYDQTTQLWHERRSGTGLVNAVWGINCVAPVSGRIYAGGSAGHVGYLDLDTFTEFGNPIRSAAVSPPVYNEGLRAQMFGVEVECELGVGIGTGQGSDPQVMMRWSDDGGATWSNERTASLGKTGNRIDRAIVRRMGQFRQREIEVSISDPVKRCFYGFRPMVAGAAT